MSTWIPVYTSLLDHPKKYRVADLLDIDPVLADGLLVNFWGWCSGYADDGIVGGFTHRELARAARWRGDADIFVEAMIDAGWIDLRDDGELVVHDWADYFGRYATKREQHRLHQQAHRERKQGPNEGGDITGSSREAHVSVTGGSRDTLDKSREDKSREDKSREDEIRVEKTREELHIPSAPADEHNDVPTPEKKDRVKTETTPDFDAFWLVYPKKVSKAAAMAVWKQINPGPDLVQQICSAAEDQQSWPTWKDGFIPDPERWLKKNRWADERPPDARNGKGDKRPTNAQLNDDAFARVSARRERGETGVMIDAESRVLR
jgi:hypothetical protein